MKLPAISGLTGNCRLLPLRRAGSTQVRPVHHHDVEAFVPAWPAVVTHAPFSASSPDPAQQKGSTLTTGVQHGPGIGMGVKDGTD